MSTRLRSGPRKPFDNAEEKAFLAETLGYLGERDEAVRLIEGAMPFVQADLHEQSRYESLHIRIIRALVAAGEHDWAVDELGDYLQEPDWWSIEGIEKDPRFDPIRAHPGYRALVVEYGRQS